MSDKKYRTVSRVQFFRLCEELKKKRDLLLRERPSLPAAAKQLGEWLGIRVSAQAISEAQEATGVKWTVLKHCATAQEKTNRYRILARAVIRLYRKLGEEVPGELLETYASSEGKSVEEVSKYFKSLSPEQTERGWVGEAKH